MKKVLIALSGGMDSAATVFLLKKQGLQVEALHLQVGEETASVEAARRNALWLDVKLTVLDVQKEFSQSVIGYFGNELRNGRTPAPCSFCNPNFKWHYLLEFANNNNFDYIATGHYVQIEKINQHHFIKRGVDNTKDQSYYLWDLPQEVLSRALFPLGTMTKNEVRELLKHEGYQEIAQTKESMSLCFLPSGVSYADFVARFLTVEPGEVVDKQGNVIGYHKGTPLYTIGQKRGFEITQEQGWAVLETDVKNNKLIVSNDPQSFYTQEITLTNYRAQDPSLLSGDDLRIMVRGLGRNPQGRCKATLSENKIQVKLLDDSAWAVAAGQPAVFYKGNILVGGGYAE